MPVSIRLARAITLAITLTSGAASAAQLDYTLYTGIEHSDNIDLSPTNPISQNVLIPGFNFTYTQQGSTIQANVTGNVEYRDYLGNAFSNQLFTQISGQANWTVLPQRLDFAVEDYAGVQPVASLSTNTPNNQQQTNVLVLGPTLYFHLGGTLHGQAELRYIDSSAQKTAEFDSSRGQAALRIFKDLNATDQLSANVESQRVDFDNSEGGPNYDRSELFGRYVSKLAHFDIDTILGWSQINFDHAPSVTTPLAQITLDWRATSNSTFTVIAAHQYTDAAQDMIVQPGQIIPGPVTGTNAGPVTSPVGSTGINTGNAVINSQAYLERSLEGIYTFTSDRLTLHLAPLYRELSYPNDPTINQTGRGGSAGLDYRLREQLTLSTFVNQETIHYDALDRRDKTLNYGLSLAGNRTPHWGWRFSLMHQQQNSTVSSQRFHENEIYFGVVFKR